MDRINHVKVASPDPERIKRFLTEVVDIPDGWPIGPVDAIEPSEVMSAARDEHGDFTRAAVLQLRGGAHDRCGQFGAACTEIHEHAWGEGTITFFYAEVGGVVFEVMRINP
jgi:hypothetical protein